LKRLGTKENPSDCAKLFGGYEKALKLLNKTKYEVGNVLLDDGTHGIAAVVGNTIILDPTREFFSDKKQAVYFDFGIKGKTINGRIAMINGVVKTAFTLIHEMGHKAKIYDKDYDKDNSTKSLLAQANNNEKFRKACFSDITELEEASLFGDITGGN
jgi:hypothetical protein